MLNWSSGTLYAPTNTANMVLGTGILNNFIHILNRFDALDMQLEANVTAGSVTEAGDGPHLISFLMLIFF